MKSRDMKSKRSTQISLVTICSLSFALTSLQATANAPSARSDLRDLRVGMPATALPAQGYVELICANNPDQKLNSWSEYSLCRADDKGRYDIGFKFDESTNVLGPLDDKYTGTRVGGHPVILTLTINSAARVTGLEIKTDPKARLSLRKRAFLLARQAMNFYGSNGWKCESQRPGASEAPIGSVFIKERCEKAFPDKNVIVERQFFRPIDTDIRNLVSTSEITVLDAN